MLTLVSLVEETKVELFSIEFDTNQMVSHFSPPKHLKAVAIVRNSLLIDQVTNLDVERLADLLSLVMLHGRPTSVNISSSNPRLLHEQL